MEVKSPVLPLEVVAHIEMEQMKQKEREKGVTPIKARRHKTYCKAVERINAVIKSLRRATPSGIKVAPIEQMKNEIHLSLQNVEAIHDLISELMEQEFLRNYDPIDTMPPFI